MPPHVERVLENGLVFDPDDLLVNKNAALPHRLLNFNLSLRRVPHVDCCIVLTNGQSLSQIGLVERAQGLAPWICLRTDPSNPCSCRRRSPSRSGSSRHTRPDKVDQWHKVLRPSHPSALRHPKRSHCCHTSAGGARFARSDLAWSSIFSEAQPLDRSSVPALKGRSSESP